MLSGAMRAAAIGAALVMVSACAADDHGWYEGLRDHVHATWVPPAPPPDYAVEPLTGLTPTERSAAPRRPYMAAFAAQDSAYHHQPRPVLMRSEIEHGLERAPPPAVSDDSGPPFGTLLRRREAVLRGEDSGCYVRVAAATPGAWRRVVCDEDVTAGLVLTVQRALDAQGYEQPFPDGIFAPRTEAAIIAFQRDRGLAVGAPFSWETLTALGVRVPAPA